MMGEALSTGSAHWWAGYARVVDFAGASRLPVAWLGAHDGVVPSTPELWKREYHLRLIPLAEVASPPSRREPQLVFAGDREKMHFLPDWAPSSVRLFIDWDETFMTDLVNDVVSRPQVAELVRNYPIAYSGWPEILPNAGIALREARAKSWVSVGPAARSWMAGAVVAKRKAQARRRLGRAGVVVTEVPLGYTDMFVAGLGAVAAELGWRPLRDAESLVTYVGEHDEHLSDLKDTTLGYVGQRGTFQRQCGIDIALSMGYPIGPVRSGYGGQGASSVKDAAITYVSAMAHARFALCPPGNYAGDSFRFGEALLLGALPVEVSRVISEPGRTHVGDLEQHTVNAPTWREALMKMTAMSEGERLDRLDRARSAYTDQLARARSALRGQPTHGGG